MRNLLTLLLCGLTAWSADRYVSPGGANSGDAGSWGTAWATLTYAAANADSGDTIYVGEGEYNEYVTVQGKPNLTWIGTTNAVTCAFNLISATNTFDNLIFRRTQSEGNTWLTMIRITSTAHGTVITNCQFRDTPFVMGTNFFFDDAAQTITCTNVNFVDAGFRANGRIYWGGSSLPRHHFANLGRSGAIVNVAEHAVSYTHLTLPTN